MNTNSDAHIEAKSHNKVMYRVSVRYKSFIVEELLLTKTEKNAVIHFLYVLSRAMKRDNGSCPFYYKSEEETK